MPSVITPPLEFTGHRIQELWRQLNDRYFRSALRTIDIQWSDRLTSSAGMFVCRVGPRQPDRGLARRLIKLSAHLLAGQPAQEIIETLAHEMIHHWQYDVLKRRPNHGPDFCRKMTEMNRDGFRITIHHRLDDAVQALSKYAWRCVECGQVYHRQRHTIRPRRHRCGACQGALRQIEAARAEGRHGPSRRAEHPGGPTLDIPTTGPSPVETGPKQLKLEFGA